MKQKLFIFLILILLIVLLVGLNAATYVQKEKVPDTELTPNRSTYNSGSTGTQALYSLLSETGRKVTRWQSSLESIGSNADDRPSVFVMIGPLRRELDDTENTKLMEWVSSGGTLVLIDREPSQQLAMTTSQWQISVSPKTDPDLFVVDASDQKQMTANTPAHKPSLPSRFSHGVNAVQPSRFASSIGLERFKDVGAPTNVTSTVERRPTATPYDFLNEQDPPPPPVKRVEGDPHISDPDDGEDSEVSMEPVDEGPSFEAPIVHVAGSGRNLLVEAPFAEGRVIVLSDPYIVSNAGINVVDNSRLAVNLVTSRDGLIAFDEYHHGHGANNNRLFQYFEGTPVIAIFLQCGLLVALVFFSQSRRFARPVPEPEPNRLSKLEYVSAMAELQQRTRAYDLAIENIYADFRRRVCSMVGLDNTIAGRMEIAERVAERTGDSAKEIESLMFKCEDVIRGGPVGKRETVGVIESIRRIEEKLGLKRSGRKGV
jgi:hypothetical protein